MRPSPLPLLLLSLLPAMAPLADEPLFDEEMTIVGSREQASQTTGSAHLIGPSELEHFAYSDIQRIVRQVPGVSIQVEDGYGLRPNISIRGVATERSSRVTLLEDNILIAPAPYSAPSAYYFPTVGRMYGFEVLKGPSAITQGPYTIGGALNMISTPIPGGRGGALLAEGGEDASYRLHAHYGATLSNGIGFLLETHQWGSDGYQSIDRGGDSGLRIEDYTAKLSFAPTGSAHRVDLKLQYADQDSDQSYLGLTDGDFGGDAYRRYGLSALDNIATRHAQVILRYRYDRGGPWRLSATAYNNTHERNWFKTEGIDFDGSPDAQSFERSNWFDVIQAINRSESFAGLTASGLQAILDGTADTPAGSLQLRANQREYFSRGIQLGFELEGTTGALAHQLELGVRYHEDEEDRLQRNSNYHQSGGSLVLDDVGLLGNAGNRIQSAEALAVHVYDRITAGNWVFTPGLRYEDIDQSRVRYEIRAGQTTDPASRASDNIRDQRSNQTQVWLPGLGALYRLNDRVSLLGGVHKGFTAPSNSPGVAEEVAINYELGMRYSGTRADFELVGFLSDYDNLLGVCTASSGSDCDIGDAFNGDAATVKGVEFLLTTDLMRSGSFSVPLMLTYTWIDGQFDTDIADTDFFGDVRAGDPVPYIPRQQLLASLGLERGRFSGYLSANYVDEVCVRASCGEFESTEALLALDTSASFELTSALNLFLRVENLTGEKGILGRQPYGARPNKDRTFTLGVRVRL